MLGWGGGGGGDGGGGRVICKVIFMSSPTTVLMLCCVGVRVVTICFMACKSFFVYLIFFIWGEGLS